MTPALMSTLQDGATGLHCVLQDDGRAGCVALHLQPRLVWPTALAPQSRALLQRLLRLFMEACVHTPTLATLLAAPTCNLTCSHDSNSTALPLLRQGPTGRQRGAAMEMLAGAMAAAVGGQCSQHAQQPLPPRSVAVAVGAMVAVEVDAVVAIVLVAASTVVAPVSSATATVSTHMALACSRQQWRRRWREPGGVVATMHTMPVQPSVAVPAGVVVDAAASQPAPLGCSAAASADLCAQRAAVSEAGGSGSGRPTTARQHDSAPAPWSGAAGRRYVATAVTASRGTSTGSDLRAQRAA